MRNYSELSKLETFEERFRYLMIGGAVGDETFGFDRYLNQTFYRSPEWQAIRKYVILRDHGCDLGIQGQDICGRMLIHHMNPIGVRDLLDRSDILLNPEYLITVQHNTHNAIHYGDTKILERHEMADRSPNDQCPWRKAL